MDIQNIIVYILLAASVVFLAFKYLKPKKNPPQGKAGDKCDTDCNC